MFNDCIEVINKLAYTTRHTEKKGRLDGLNTNPDVRRRDSNPFTSQYVVRDTLTGHSANSNKTVRS